MGFLEARRPPQPDVTKIPTPPLQAVALFINFFLPALALIAVALRFYARDMLRQLAIEDWFLLLALLFSLAMVVPFYFYLKLNYWGWREIDVPELDPSPGLWWFYLAQIFYNPVLALVKASALLFLLRLGGHKRRVRYFIYGLLTFNGLQAVAVFFVAILMQSYDHWSYPDSDPYYDIGLTLNALEINLAIVSGSIPGLRPIFRKWFSRGQNDAVIARRAITVYSNDPYRYKSNDRYGGGTSLRSGIGAGAESGLAHDHGGIGLKNLSRSDRAQHTEIRSVSPSGSEEEIMTSNGIMRTTDVEIHYTSETTLNPTGSRASSDYKLPEAAVPRGL
ncbi:hypothetical protein GGR58DRAFT_506652 [Xylaria digitata]|nr:hypothetical protein GGR58DRAFT_506652 [Xylaria digitata]